MIVFLLFKSPFHNLCNASARVGATEGTMRVCSAHHQFPFSCSYSTVEVGGVEGAPDMHGLVSTLPAFHEMLLTNYEKTFSGC